MVIISTESPPDPYGYFPHHPPPRGSRTGYDTDMISFIPVTPIRSKSQEAMMKKDGELELRARNIRVLQRLIRRRVPNDFVLPLLDPYNEWAFLDINSDAATFLAKAALTGAQLEGIEQMIGSNFDENRIKRTFLSIEAREKALHAWNVDYHLFPNIPVPEPSIRTAESDSNTDDNSSTDERWSNFPLHIREVIHKIESANPEDVGDRFYWEQRFLDLLVDPKEVGKGWSDIAIDPETEEEIREVIKQHMDSTKPAASYGILKRGNIGGALLYGPPGTGKTQLARVLACVSESVVICASSADIENKWAGEMPKAIRGLFNLGKLLAPSVIFIDEADSLFQSRDSYSDYPSWR
ncbi:hypothetical protein INS49_004079 [Diaporthe citri]|uniref:uncharacterized protein n=1 Tax=Diaporthe citri TaxID=83186 RepID=UPI001C7EB24E|nr:uncharacterized protein INS49_004079 [Diaporthe citri]KAG6354998.1 hypothetical protein INS49_004079 [Diaporthe citri]